MAKETTPRHKVVITETKLKLGPNGYEVIEPKKVVKEIDLEADDTNVQEELGEDDEVVE